MCDFSIVFLVGYLSPPSFEFLVEDLLYVLDYYFRVLFLLRYSSMTHLVNLGFYLFASQPISYSIHLCWLMPQYHLG
jgi:hypothetical protein